MDVVKRLEVLAEIDRTYRCWGTALSITRASTATDEELVDELKRVRKERLPGEGDIRQRPR
jgi:regulator of RNase E activity RraB